ncbi:MAG: two-component system response regulator KdpE [Sterolibacterium sp.]|jgi:two-component system KDP operon response regulator KdpE
MSEPLPVVILIEDEPKIRRFVKMSLEAEGCEVYEADSVQRGLIEAGTRRPDMVVLDLGLPDGDGVDFIRDLRAWSDIPIIVLSARTTEADKVGALDAGADDYLSKPFGAAELLARVRAQLRRRSRAGGGAATLVEFGKIRVDLGKRIVEREGQPLHLTPIEYRLLAFLITHPDSVLTHRQLLKNVWGPSHAEDSHYVRVFMGLLRKKIEDDPSQPKHIVTEAGVGYRFVT